MNESELLHELLNELARAAGRTVKLEHALDLTKHIVDGYLDYSSTLAQQDYLVGEWLCECKMAGCINSITIKEKLSGILITDFFISGLKNSQFAGFTCGLETLTEIIDLLSEIKRKHEVKS